MLKDVKLEAIDQSISMLMKKEPCNHDPVVSLASHVKRPVVAMKSNQQQQAVGSYEMNSTFVPTTMRSEEPIVVVRGSNNADNSSSVVASCSGRGSGSGTVPQIHPRDPRRRPVVIPASSSLASTSSFASSSGNGVVVAKNKSPVVVEQAAKSVVASSSSFNSPSHVVERGEKGASSVVVNNVKSPVVVKQAAKSVVASSSSFNSPSHVVERGEKGASSVVVNNVKSPVVVSRKQADDVVVGSGGGGHSAAAAAIHHHKSPVKIESDNQTKQATLDSSYSLCGDNTSSSSASIAVSSSSVIHDGDCSAKPIVLSKATTVKKSNTSTSQKTIVSPAAYRASRGERLTSEKVYTTSIPPYDAPAPSKFSSSSPPPRPAPAPATTTTVTTAPAPASSAKRAAETSVNELHRQKQIRTTAAALDTTASRDEENVIAMETMLSDLKGKLVTLTLDLCITPHKQELSDAYSATTTQINYLKRTIASLKKNTTPLLSSLSDENYKKLVLMLRLVPYFQWEGHVTNAREKVFTTIYACLRQVDRAVQDYDFDIERKWKSLIPHKLSSSMHHWLDGLLIRQPHLTWSQFKKQLLQEYEMPLTDAIKQLTLAHYNEATESMNSFTTRFVRNLEYAQVSEELGFTYFQSALPTLEDRVQFGILYQNVKKNHPQDKNNLYCAIDLFRDIHNQICPCNDAFENPPLPAPQPQPYELHHRASQQAQQQRSVSPKVEVIQQQQQQKPKFKKQKFTHPKKPQLHCLLHPRAHSHSTENCRNNPNSPSFVNV